MIRCTLWVNIYLCKKFKGYYLTILLIFIYKERDVEISHMTINIIIYLKHNSSYCYYSLSFSIACPPKTEDLLEPSSSCSRELQS